MLAPLTAAAELPNAYDTDAFYAPYAAFLHDQLSHGDLPLWNPFAFSGQPLAADPQSGVLYPPALVAYGLFAPATGMVVLVTFHYLLATLSSYSFARLIGAAASARSTRGSRSASRATCSRARRRSGCWPAPRGSPPASPPRSTPCTARGAGASPLVLAGALALSILGGSQQLTAVAATAALVVLVLQLRRRGLAIFVGAGVAALGLAAVALLPRLELVSRSTAANGVVDPAGVGTLSWADAKRIFGSFGSHAGELAPLYAAR